MEKQEEIEKAFLAWLNSLEMEKEPLSSILSLKDGVFLVKFLKKIVPDYFSLEGFSLQPDHWSLCVSNLQKLMKSMDKYYKTELKMTLPADFVDIQAIARQNDKTHILRLVFFHIMLK